MTEAEVKLVDALETLARSRLSPPDTYLVPRIDFIRWMRREGKTDEWINTELVKADCLPIGENEV